MLFQCSTSPILSCFWWAWYCE